MQRLPDVARASFEMIDPALYAGTVVRAVRECAEHFGIISFYSSATAGGYYSNAAAGGGAVVSASGAPQIGGDAIAAHAAAGHDVGGGQPPPAMVMTLSHIRFGSSSLLVSADGRGAGARAGDEVTFQVATMLATGDVRAVNVCVTQRLTAAPETTVVSDDKHSAVVTVVKGKYGFLAHTVEGSGSDNL